RIPGEGSRSPLIPTAESQILIGKTLSQLKKPLITIWTTSQFAYDQRIQRIARTMDEMGADVQVFDRGTENHPEGRLKTRNPGGPAMYLEYNRQISRLLKQTRSDLVYAADIDVMPGLVWGLKGKKDAPLLLDLHEWFPEVMELQDKPLKKAVW